MVPQVALPLQHQELNRGMIGIAYKEHGVSIENTLTIHYDFSLLMYARKEKNNQLLAAPFGFLMGPLMLVESKLINVFLYIFFKMINSKRCFTFMFFFYVSLKYIFLS